MCLDENFVPSNELPANEQTVVYIAENKSGKFYIGSTGQKDRRLKIHIQTLSKNKHGGNGTDLFQKAFNEDPTFDFKVCPVPNREIAFQLEKELIIKSRNNPSCLNMKDAIPPPPVTDITRKKLSESGKKAYENGRISPTLGTKLSEERKNEISEYSKNIWQNPEKREKMMSYLTSDDFKSKISKIHKNKIETPETRLKKSQAKKGIPQNPEHIEKRAAALRGRIIPVEEATVRNEKIKEYIINLSEEDKSKRLLRLKEQSLLGAAKTRRPIFYNGRQYSSVLEAIKTEGISSSTMYKILNQSNSEVQNEQ